MLVELVGKKLPDARGGPCDPDSLVLVVGFGQFAAYNFVDRISQKDADNDVKKH